MPSEVTVRSTSSFATPGSSARTANSDPLSIRSTRGSRTGASGPVTRARGPPQNRSSKFRRKLSNHRSTSSNQAKGEVRSEEHTSELQSQSNLVCRLLLEKKKKYQ